MEYCCEPLQQLISTLDNHNYIDWGDLPDEIQFGYVGKCGDCSAYFIYCPFCGKRVYEPKE